MLWSREWLGERSRTGQCCLNDRLWAAGGNISVLPLSLEVSSSLQSESRLHLSLPRPPPSPPKVTESIPRAEVAAVSSVIREAGAKGTGSRSLCQLAAVLLDGNP